MGKGVKMCKTVMLSYTNVRQMQRPDQEISSLTWTHPLMLAATCRLCNDIITQIITHNNDIATQNNSGNHSIRRCSNVLNADRELAGLVQARAS